jgi:hypothetical protein
LSSGAFTRRASKIDHSSLDALAEDIVELPVKSCQLPVKRVRHSQPVTSN